MDLSNHTSTYPEIKGEKYGQDGSIEPVRSEARREAVAREGSGDVEIDSELDRAITRKFDIHLVPWLFGLWLLAFIDRSNIGNARLDGLEKDLGLVGNRFNIVGYLIQVHEPHLT